MNPTTNENIGVVINANEEIVNRAVVNAQSVFEEWNVTCAIKRAEIIEKFAYLLEEHHAKFLQ